LVQGVGPVLDADVLVQQWVERVGNEEQSRVVDAGPA